MAVLETTEVPVYLQVGDAERSEIGAITFTPTLAADGTITVTMGSIPDLLREARAEAEAV